MKKVILSILMFLVIGCGFTVYAQGQTQADPSVISRSEQSITPYASVIEYKIREYYGRIQYRRWHKTLGYWVDPYWIDF